MAAVREHLPSLTEGELLASRLRRRRRVLRALPAAPKSASAPCAAGLARLDSYKRLRTIGQGAFGTVSKARDRRTGEVVAIKSVHEKGRDANAALLREAALLAACAANPAVVAFREVVRGGSEPDDLHLGMEFVGRSLYDVIGERRSINFPFSESETRSTMAQLLAGVGTMHAHGIMHRDLKPGNVLVGERDGCLKICDFGLARSIAAPPPLDTELDGTPGYMAPEVLLCEDNGELVDTWALGCIMAELVIGQSLFPEDDMCQQLVNIIDLLGIPDDVSLMPLGITAGTPSKLRDKVPEERLSAAGFDVLRGLLQYHAKDRLTATAALQMPWFG